MVDQILALIAYVPSMTLCKESISVFKGSLDLLKVYSHLDKTHHQKICEMINLTLNVSLSKL